MKAKKDPMISTVTGAVMGGLLGGPFGAFFGANIGSNLASQQNVKEEKKQQLERLGLSPTILAQAELIGAQLFEAEQAVSAIETATASSLDLARLLEAESESFFTKAEKLLTGGNEDEARQFLLKRAATQKRQKSALKNVIENRALLDLCKEKKSLLAGKASEIESLLVRSVGASSIAQANEILDLEI